MPRLFVGNFSFEQAASPGQNLSRRIERFEAELAWIWLAVAEPGDEILCPQAIPDEYWDRMAEWSFPRITPLLPEELSQSQANEVVPWGWTESIRRLAASLKIPVRAPDQKAVWEVNSRKFAFEVCQEQGLTLPGEGLANSLEEVQTRISDLVRNGYGWIIKPNHGQAGRGQLRGWEELSPKDRATVARILQQQGIVQIEPWLDRVVEVGCQWEIAPDGTVQLVGINQLLTDSRGAYRGSVVKSLEISEEARDNLERAQRPILQQIAKRGYFGPVGIDGMMFRDAGQVSIRPVQDINARWTMGRIATQWHQYGWHQKLFSLDRTEPCCECWWQGTTSDPDALRLSPETIGGRAVEQVIWWLNRSPVT